MKPPTLTERAAQSAHDRAVLRSRLIGTPAPARSTGERIQRASEAMREFGITVANMQTLLLDWTAAYQQVPDEWFLDAPPAWEHR